MIISIVISRKEASFLRIAGIIAEYDPFHKGHAAHIAATRAENGGNASHIVAVISGNFTQRGEPALISKFRRAEMALANGVDLVLELPLPWAMAPAENFAAGGVAILNALGGVDTLSFGSECGDASALKKIAELSTDGEYQNALRNALSSGIPYAAAGQIAVAQLLSKDAAEPLSTPNNTLAIEYMRAAMAQGANFDYFTLTRQGTLHNENAPNQGFAAASLLRNWMRSGNVESVAHYMPSPSFQVLKTAFEAGETPSDPYRLSTALTAQLRRMGEDAFARLPWLSEGLENRLYKCSRTSTNLEELLAEAKTRRYPMARLRRVLWAALIGITAEDVLGLPPYIRVLGMNGKGREILATARPTLPLLTRTAQLSDLSEKAQRIFQLECTATDLYALTLPKPQACGADHTHKFIVIE